MFKYIFTVLFFTLSLLTNAQSIQVQQLKSLNNYIEFSNESTHGMLIVYRLLENFNKKVNVYVVTNDKSFSNYTNADLPQDIFLDLDKWFYEVSPKEWYKIAIKESICLKKEDSYQLNFIIKQMQEITSHTNQFRFQLEEYVNFLNFKDPVFLEKLYDELVTAIPLFDQYYKQMIALEAMINKIKPGLEKDVNNPLFKDYDQFYKGLRTTLNGLRNENNAEIFTGITLYKEHFSKFDTGVSDSKFSNPRSKKRLKYIKEKSRKVQISMDNYLADKAVPEEYNLYGSYYYYHNSELLNKTNKYGNGLVTEMNKIIDLEKLSKVKYFEVPHYLKVMNKKLTWRKRDYKKDHAKYKKKKK